MKRPHPPKDMETPSKINSHIFAKESVMGLQFKERISKSPLVFIGVPELYRPSNLLVNVELTDRVITVDRSRVASCHRWFCTEGGDMFPRFVFESDPLLPQRRRVGIPFAPEMKVSSSLFSVTQDGRTVISCGHWDNSFKLTLLDSVKQTQSISWHKDIVTCLSLGRDGRTLVTGSKDTTLAIWQVFQRGSQYRVMERPSLILHGHNDEVTCVCISVELDVAVSGGKDGRVIVHSLRKGMYVRSMRGGSHRPVTLVGVNGDKIVTYTASDLTVRVFGLNGMVLSSFETKERLRCLVVSREGKYLLMGGQQGVTCRDANSLEVVCRESTEVGVSSLVLANEEKNVLVGLENGRLLVFAAEEGKGKE